VAVSKASTKLASATSAAGGAADVQDDNTVEDVEMKQAGTKMQENHSESKTGTPPPTDTTLTVNKPQI